MLYCCYGGGTRDENSFGEKNSKREKSQRISCAQLCLVRISAKAIYTP